MQPPDVMILDVLVIAIGVIIIGAVMSAVQPILWFGIVVAVGILVAWIVNFRFRHSTHHSSQF